MFRKQILTSFKNLRTSFMWGCRNVSRTRTLAEAESKNKPIAYSESLASQWKARNTRAGTLDNFPPAQPYVVLLSVAVFMIYFCILREENDIDMVMGKTLYEHIDGLEEVQLMHSIKYNKEHNIDTTQLETRLKEIKQSKESNRN